MTDFRIDLVPLYCEFAQRGTVVAFDTETTGFHNHDDVVQLAVVVMKDGKEQFAKAVYLKNQVPVDGTEAQSVNGITDALLAEKGLDPKLVLEDFLALLNCTIEEEGRVLLVAHNLSFDFRMMNNMLHRYGCDTFPNGVIGCCTKEFAKALQLPKTILPGNHLRHCIDKFGIKGSNSHDALDDAKACMELFKFLVS